MTNIRDLNSAAVFGGGGQRRGRIGWGGGTPVPIL